MSPRVKLWRTWIGGVPDPVGAILHLPNRFLLVTQAALRRLEY